MRLHRAAATALVAVLALSGCDGGSDPTDPSPTAQPSDSSSAPSTTPPTENPTEPVLPTAATKATEAGARAFITYYWDLINYAQVTGDVKALKSVSGPNCAGCNAGVRGIRDVYRNGGHAEGGDYTTTIGKIKKVAFERDDAFAFESDVSVRNDEQIITEGDGTTRKLSSSENDLVVYVLWVGERWRMDVLATR